MGNYTVLSHKQKSPTLGEADTLNRRLDSIFTEELE